MVWLMVSGYDKPGDPKWTPYVTEDSSTARVFRVTETRSD
jgi:hypothetical protein